MQTIPGIEAPKVNTYVSSTCIFSPKTYILLTTNDIDAHDLEIVFTILILLICISNGFSII